MPKQKAKREKAIAWLLLDMLGAVRFSPDDAKNAGLLLVIREKESSAQIEKLRASGAAAADAARAEAEGDGMLQAALPELISKLEATTAEAISSIEQALYDKLKWTPMRTAAHVPPRPAPLPAPPPGSSTAGVTAEVAAELGEEAWEYIETVLRDNNAPEPWDRRYYAQFIDGLVEANLDAAKGFPAMRARMEADRVRIAETAAEVKAQREHLRQLEQQRRDDDAAWDALPEGEQQRRGWRWRRRGAWNHTRPCRPPCASGWTR